MLVVALSAGMSSAGAKSDTAREKESRVVTRAYSLSHGVWLSHYDENLPDLPLDPLVFKPKPQDRYIDFEIADKLGTAVALHVKQEGGPDGQHVDGHYDDSGALVVCAQLYRYELISKEPVEVRIYSGACPNHTFGFSSQGTVTASFVK
jgi:hypothetical protein